RARGPTSIAFEVCPGYGRERPGRVTGSVPIPYQRRAPKALRFRVVAEGALRGRGARGVLGGGAGGVQDGADPGGEGGRGAGLLEEGRAVLEDAVAQHRVVRVAREEQHGEVGGVAAQALGQRP